jgi:hypothetical protein
MARKERIDGRRDPTLSTLEKLAPLGVKMGRLLE